MALWNKKISRDWWAVILAAITLVIAKLGILNSVPW